MLRDGYGAMKNFGVISSAVGEPSQVYLADKELSDGDPLEWCR